MKRVPKGFVLLCHGLHQDALVERPTMDELARDCLGFVPPEEYRDLAAFIATALERQTPAELKGHLNRQKNGIIMNSKSALAFFLAVDARLKMKNPAA
jgi:hypothetical protein